MKIYCVIPAWNQAKNVGRVVTEVLPLVDMVIVVDDGSVDETAQVAKQAGAFVLKHFINRGQGASLRTGTHYALSVGADIIIHFDSDGQFLASDIKSLIKPLLAHEADIVFGSRFLETKSDIPKAKRYLIMPLAHLVNRVFFGIKLTDPQSGLRAFSAHAGAKLNWQEDRMAHCSEILALAYQNQLRIKEVPMTVIYHHFGQRFSGGFKILKDLFLNKLSH